jgi:hypothetical protein
MGQGCGGTRQGGGALDNPDLDGGASGMGDPNSPGGYAGKANPVPTVGGESGADDPPSMGGDGGYDPPIIGGNGGYDPPIIGGNGGFAGSGEDDPPIIGGYGGEIGDPWVGSGGGGAGGDDGDPDGHLTDCNGCSVIEAEGQDIRAIVASDTAVWWVDYGTHDLFGNHNADGQLFARPLAGGQPVLVGESLEGPVGLALSAQYAYITLDESAAVAGKGALSRVSLGGSAARLLTSYHGGMDVPELPGHFVAGTGEVFLFVDQAIYRIAETAGAEQSLFHPATGVFEIFGDASFIYLYDAVGLHTLPHAGGQPTLLQALETATFGGPRYSHLTIADGFIYGREDSYLARMPKTGGPMKRVAQFSGWGYSHVMVAGDRWVWDPSATTYPYQRQIVQESFANPTVHHVLVTANASEVTGNGWGPMVLTSAGVFFENRGGITLAPLQ